MGGIWGSCYDRVSVSGDIRGYWEAAGLAGDIRRLCYDRGRIWLT